YHGDLDVGHQLLGDGARDRLEYDRKAAASLQCQCLGGDPRGRLGGAALGLPATERGGALRSQADVSHDRDPRADDRAGATGGSRSAALELDRVAARLLDHPDGGGDRLLVAYLIRAEGEVADHQGGLQATA